MKNNVIVNTNDKVRDLSHPEWQFVGSVILTEEKSEALWNWIDDYFFGKTSSAIPLTSS